MVLKPNHPQAETNLSASIRELSISTTSTHPTGAMATWPPVASSRRPGYTTMVRSDAPTGCQWARDAYRSSQPCVDCGLWTGNWCHFCYGEQRMPNSTWEPGQHTPLCTHCDRDRDACHYCKEVPWCTPFPHGHRTPAMPNQTGDL